MRKILIIMGFTAATTLAAKLAGIAGLLVVAALAFGVEMLLRRRRAG
jgi:hypothetical protein